MPTHSESLTVRTNGKGTYEITSEIEKVVKKSAVAIGQVSIFIQHTSASLVLFENADRSARTDLDSFFERLGSLRTPETALASYVMNQMEQPLLPNEKSLKL